MTVPVIIDTSDRTMDVFTSLDIALTLASTSLADPNCGPITYTVKREEDDILKDTRVFSVVEVDNVLRVAPTQQLNDRIFVGKHTVYV